MSRTCKTRIIGQKLDCLNSNPDLAYRRRPSEKRMLPMSRYASVRSVDRSTLRIVKDRPTGSHKGISGVPK
jgi:hypothetical protein